MEFKLHVLKFKSSQVQLTELNLTLGKDSQEEEVLKQSGNCSTTTATAPKSSNGGGPHARQPKK